MVEFKGTTGTVGDFVIETFNRIKDSVMELVNAYKLLSSGAIRLNPFTGAVTSRPDTRTSTFGIGSRAFSELSSGRIRVNPLTGEMFAPATATSTEDRLRSGEQLSEIERIQRQVENRARARASEQKRLREGLVAPSVPTGLSTDDIVNNVAKTTEAIRELTDQQRSLINFTDELSLSMTDAFGSILSGAQTAGQAIRSLVDDLAALIIKQTLLVPLANTISTSLTGILGGTQAGLNVFAPGSPNPENGFLGGDSKRFGAAATRELTSVGATTAATITTTAATTAAGITTAAAATAAASLTAGAASAGAVGAASAVPAAAGAASLGATAGVTGFAKGGIISGPTLFRDGLAGEAGPEAILPLKRDASGNLGVAGSERSVTINMQINTPNSDSFRRSSRQIFSDAQRAAVRLT